MARQQVVTFTDDITGKRADETVSFGLDGTAYEIDLSTKNATKLREALKPFQSAARKASTALSRKGKTKGSGGNRERSAEIRAWAKSHGIEVSERGRIGERSPRRSRRATPAWPRPRPRRPRRPRSASSDQAPGPSWR